MPPVADELSITILRRLADSPDVNQRELAQHAGVSLGRLNYALRALVDKGWVKVGNFSRSPYKLGYAYLLTPGGIEAKAKLTRTFLDRKMREYDALRDEIERLQHEVEGG
ncbi:MAG: MarR family EPS-associated transcriptional regulator [Arenimonas sp.]|uniref:MarR family EPS-associated transcriptional regulator n=1 Tax=Arenimonas sp. TaxID=1872635 RepID=UPI0025C3A622|nr:MarR family EPS-associated transcriptional regulator [Arenimonas sp.]MBW8366837.1 MarR family EPS-associated transcriptional regulator [Arenimonas sp.]